KKVSFFSSFGISVDYLIRANNSLVIRSDNLDTYKSTNPSPYNYNLFNITPFIGFGADFQLNKKINVLVEPMFSYSVLKIIDDQPITGYLWNSGLRLSFQVKI
ncbi:MAG: hypothetical protein HN381_12760, partial [Bacteroidetes bacterium]|nr:hypothetical protein [Bacteroidota bacterium]